VTTAEHDFHLAGGGPLARLASRIRFGRAIVAAQHRAVAIAIFIWVPGLAFAIAQHVALPGRVHIPFLLDPEVYARYLIALPLLVLAEIGVDRAGKEAIEQFVRSGLVPEGELPALRALLEQAQARRSSPAAALVVALLAIVPLFIQGVGGWSAEYRDTWYLAPDGVSLTAAGIWILFIGQGALRYVIYGWIWRLTVWAMLLGRIMTLKLRTFPSHPDRAAGLGFLGLTQARFGVIAFAASAGVSGSIARDLIFQGAKLSPQFVSLGLYVLALTALLMLPLLATAPHLFRIRRQGLFDYGVLASRYEQRFDGKWVNIDGEPGPDLLGTDDIQSLDSLGASYDRVNRMLMIPIDRAGLLSIVIAAAAPMLPLVLIDPEARVLVTELLRKLV